jgi:glycosyltransferase involved in cell wall biosynthesis
MTVYIFIEWFLPAFKGGGPIQSIANLVDRQQEGITYKLISSNKDLDKTKVGVSPDRWLRRNGCTEVYYSSRGTDAALWGQKEDVLFINGIYSWHYNIRPILFSNAGRKIVSSRGMLNAAALAQKSWKKKIFITLWKLARIQHRVEFHASSWHEEEEIRKIFGPGVTVHLATNFPRLFAKQPVPAKQRGELTLISVALISPMKNILRVLQALQQTTEKVTYHIYGPVKEASYWEDCRAVITTLPQNITLHYHGDVHPEKVEESLHSGHVFILPSKFENFCHAIFEAFTAGKPVITSHRTPWSGLEQAGAGLNVNGDDPAELARAIRFFAAMDHTELQSWSNSAASYAASAIDLEDMQNQYRKMFGLTTHIKKIANQKNWRS